MSAGVSRAPRSPLVDADPVAVARRQILSSGEAAQVTDLFRLLGDPTRLRMLYALADAGELGVCDLGAVVDVAEHSVSHALRLLRAAGIVRSHRRGRMVYYSLDDDHVVRLLDLARATPQP